MMCGHKSFPHYFSTSFLCNDSTFVEYSQLSYISGHFCSHSYICVNTHRRSVRFTVFVHTHVYVRTQNRSRLRLRLRAFIVRSVVRVLQLGWRFPTSYVMSNILGSRVSRRPPTTCVHVHAIALCTSVRTYTVRIRARIIV